MTKNHWIKCSILAAIVICVCSVSGLAVQRESRDHQMDCNSSYNSYGDRLVSHCEVREETIPSGGALSVDGKQNGGISIKGWDKNNILVRSQVQTGAPSTSEARDLAGQINIRTGGGQVYAEGPGNNRDRQWSVNYEIFVPRQFNLTLKSYNGGISVSEVSGRIEFDALNGGVSLNRLGGNVHGKTTNGGLSITLEGDRWDGEGMDVRTSNGGITMNVPENYSAHLETSTINGGMNFGFPITVQGRLNRDISIDLGSGGATVRAVTTNGGVNVRRR
jgi:hypothetical protein